MSCHCVGRETSWYLQQYLQCLLCPYCQIAWEFGDKKNHYLYYDPSGAATELIDNAYKDVKSDKVAVIGTFYDVGGTDDLKEDLKYQVQEFINWLKGQGII